jgi:UPF0755 protein
MQAEQVRSTFTKRNSIYIRLFVLFCVAICIFVVSVFMCATQINNATDTFPINTPFVVAEGMFPYEIAQQLEAQHFIQSAIYFEVIHKIKFKGEYLQAGTYTFREPTTTTAVIQSLMEGKNLSPLTKVTFPEGFRILDLYTYLPKSFASSTYDISPALEGYLFPDTYYIRSDMNVHDVISMLQNNFKEKTKFLDEAISTFSPDEIVILASIIEREAKDTESKYLVSGILQNRLRIDMPLQVDTSFDYLFDKESSELTERELEYDSPYNTYLYKGLPPTPIANPGLESIMAALNPRETDYLYYLTGTDGAFYYARTFEEHKRNKDTYLR